VMLMVAAGIDYLATFLDYGMTSARYFRVQMPLLAAVAGTAALACLWLVPLHGLQGAAVAVLLSTIVRIGGSLAVVVHALRALRKRATESEREGQKSGHPNPN
jgi:O-antigen/teichoic acid export membrane protein